MDADTTTLEIRAAEIVRRRAGACPDKVHDDTRSLHDFDLAMATGARGALEVTRHSDPTTAASLKMLSRIGGPRLRIKARQVCNAWTVMVQNDASIDRLVRQADGALAELERSGLTDWLDATNTDPTPEPVALLRDRLGVRNALAVGGPPAISLRQEGGLGFIRSNVAGDVALAAVSRKTRQLSEAAIQGISERLLFVWVDPLASPREAAGLLTTGQQKSEPRTNWPPCATEVWIGVEKPPPSLDPSFFEDMWPTRPKVEAVWAAFDHAERERVRDEMATAHRVPLARGMTHVWRARRGGRWERFSILTADAVLGYVAPWYRHHPEFLEV